MAEMQSPSPRTMSRGCRDTLQMCENAQVSCTLRSMFANYRQIVVQIKKFMSLRWAPRHYSVLKQVLDTSDKLLFKRRSKMGRRSALKIMVPL